MKVRRIALAAVLVPIAVVSSACRGGAEGRCAGRFEGSEVEWPIDRESFLARNATSRGAHLIYKQGREAQLELGLAPDRNIAPEHAAHEWDLDRDESNEPIAGDVILSWDDRRFLPREGYLEWQVEPASRQLSINRLDDERMIGSIVISWPQPDQVTCTFDVPGDAYAPGGGKRRVPCGHGCEL